MDRPDGDAGEAAGRPRFQGQCDRCFRCVALSGAADRDIVRSRRAGNLQYGDAGSMARQAPLEMHDLSQGLNKAVALQRKGNLAAAEGLYLQMLEVQADHADGLQMLGYLRYQQG